MTNRQILLWASTPEGKPYSFLVNVIYCQMDNRARKLRGLYRLALQDRVGNGNCIDTCSIDGNIVPMRELEKFA